MHFVLRRPGRITREPYEFRLIENVHRTDLTDAEKGDAFLGLWELSGYPPKKTLAEKEQLPYNTVTTSWIPKSQRLSDKVKELQTIHVNSFTDGHVKFLMKYPHSVQNKFAEVSVEKKLTSRQLQHHSSKILIVHGLDTSWVLSCLNHSKTIFSTSRSPVSSGR